MTFQTNLSLVGKIGNYRPVEYTVSSRGLVSTLNTAIKCYSLSVKDKPLELKTVNKAKEFVKARILDSTIKSSQSLGFTILSDGIINVSMWGGEYPSTVHQKIWTFDSQKTIHKSRLTDILKAGSYCAWEMSISAHEAKAWREYLHSSHEDTDKLKYLSDFFYGEI